MQDYINSMIKLANQHLEPVYSSQSWLKDELEKERNEKQHLIRQRDNLHSQLDSLRLELDNVKSSYERQLENERTKRASLKRQLEEQNNEIIKYKKLLHKEGSISSKDLEDINMNNDTTKSSGSDSSINLNKEKNEQTKGEPSKKNSEKEDEGEKMSIDGPKCQSPSSIDNKSLDSVTEEVKNKTSNRYSSGDNSNQLSNKKNDSPIKVETINENKEKNFSESLKKRRMEGLNEDKKEKSDSISSYNSYQNGDDDNDSEEELSDIESSNHKRRRTTSDSLLLPKSTTNALVSRPRRLTGNEANGGLPLPDFTLDPQSRVITHPIGFIIRKIDREPQPFSTLNLHTKDIEPMKICMALWDTHEIDKEKMSLCQREAYEKRHKCTDNFLYRLPSDPAMNTGQRTPWTKEEDEQLIERVLLYNGRYWGFISLPLIARVGKNCYDRFYRLLAKKHLHKGYPLNSLFPDMSVENINDKKKIISRKKNYIGGASSIISSSMMSSNSNSSYYTPNQGGPSQNNFGMNYMNSPLNMNNNNNMSHPPPGSHKPINMNGPPNNNYPMNQDYNNNNNNNRNMYPNNNGNNNNNNMNNYNNPPNNNYNPNYSNMNNNGNNGYPLPPPPPNNNGYNQYSNNNNNNNNNGNNNNYIPPNGNNNQSQNYMAPNNNNNNPQNYPPHNSNPNNYSPIIIIQIIINHHHHQTNNNNNI
ncbi:hypothetical protein H8356DRAFT_954807 [Neocallimastix lanati (nom. inval.)]|uniref:Uncharacterized protein n=1 Tax=Neocallimastix californiae TaxID=1754190 RepID=A0A1Y1ZZ09_9FUNG|nr:hypothetical protein H8356DRAFT_954807 [Neocallimastix sp. JGI-2020a]ORY15513.1 hypothetical protein LY90DRAFT_517887 [Neocallimastix californiae]|eukprot:ORY15513.1 hypothetical protein LY90DRAFT_517887 [Neocallimastix californiae]